MSAEGDLRDRLNKIHGMLPLSDRERILADLLREQEGIQAQPKPFTMPSTQSP